MPAGRTYTPLATTTLSSAASTVTFSSISGSYTDLVLVAFISSTSVDGRILRCTFNSDTGANYSATRMTGNGTTAVSTQSTGQSNIPLCLTASTSTSLPTLYKVDILNYSSSTTFKTVLSRANASASAVEATVGSWRNTSAINTITIVPSSGNFNADSTFVLYGILAA
jgi:hypothetical protein